MPNPITLQLVSSEHGFDDFDVAGHGDVHRICVGHGIQQGESFNAYGPDGVKTGVKWCGSVELSLGRFLGVAESAIQVTPAEPPAGDAPRPRM